MAHGPVALGGARTAKAGRAGTSGPGTSTDASATERGARAASARIGGGQGIAVVLGNADGK
jgi:hypothetical protein